MSVHKPHEPRLCEPRTTEIMPGVPAELTRADYLRMRVAPPGTHPHMAHVYENG